MNYEMSRIVMCFLAAISLLAMANPSEAEQKSIDVTVQRGKQLGAGFGHLRKPAHILTLNLKAPSQRQIKSSAVSGSGLGLWRFIGNPNADAKSSNVAAGTHTYEIIEVKGNFEDTGHAALFSGELVGGPGGGGAGGDGGAGGAPGFQVAVAEIDLFADGVQSTMETSEDTANVATLGLVTNGEKKKVTVRVESSASGKIKLVAYHGATICSTENGNYTSGLQLPYVGDLFNPGNNQSFDFWVQVEGYLVSSIEATFEPDDPAGPERAIDKLVVSGGQLVDEVFVHNVAIRIDDTTVKQLVCSVKNSTTTTKGFAVNISHGGTPEVTFYPTGVLDPGIAVPPLSWGQISLNVQVSGSGLGNESVHVKFWEGSDPPNWIEAPADTGLVGVYDIEIVDADGDIVAGNHETIVGKKVDLEAVVSFGDAAFSDGKWSIEGDTVKSYVQTFAAGTATELAAADLASVTENSTWIESRIEFYWIEEAKAITRFDASYQFMINGVLVEEALHYEVARPTSTLTSVVTGLNPPIDIRDLGGTNGLMYGHVIDDPGITYKATVTTTIGGNGEIAFVQLINSDLRATLSSPPFTKTKKTSNGVFLLDSASSVVDDVRYNGKTTIGSNETKAHTRDDSPYIGTATLKSASIDHEFELYLMYKPDGADSIWITLKKLDWYCRGSASMFNGALYGDAEQDSPPTNDPPGGEKWTNLPVWTGRAQDLVWVPDN